MFFSRFNYENGKIHLSFDVFTGELLEFYQKNNGDNLIKSAPWGMPNLFAAVTEAGILTVPTSAQVKNDPLLKPRTQVTENRIIIEYDRLYSAEKTLDVGVKCVLDIDGDSIKWSASVNNRQGIKISSFRYPVLGGIWLGEDFEDDILVYPHNAGVKIKSPSVALARRPKRVYWRWQDYRYVYNVGGMCGFKDSEGNYTLSNSFSGPLSMAWCDLYDEDGGLYLGMHKQNGICALRVTGCGEDVPGLYMSFEKSVQGNGNFDIDGIYTVFHKGDWHSGADIYRSAVERPVKEYPAWWKNSVALAAHYDFRYQNGGIVHKYGDMGRIAKEAELIGADHILCSGWHKGGFDNGFPLYVADDELGGKDGLEKGIAAAHEMGKKVSFYINSRIGNLYYPDEQQLIRSAAVIKEDGSAEEERYGNESLQFCTMCIGSDKWQNRLLEAINYVAELGADGVYLDQLAMAAPRMCHSKDHGHTKKDSWCEGYRAVLEKARDITTKSGEKLNVITEGISSLYGDIACGGLVSTFVYHHNGAFPELYRYTFPHHCMVDMVYPNRNLAMRPVHVAKASREMAERSFLCGMYFWIYDLEQDNTFKRDPEGLEYLNLLVKARKDWISKYPDYAFCDELGIILCQNCKAKHFVKDNEGVISFVNGGDGVITVDFVGEFDCETQIKDGHTLILLPKSKVGIVHYKKF